MSLLALQYLFSQTSQRINLIRNALTERCFYLTQVDHHAKISKHFIEAMQNISEIKSSTFCLITLDWTVIAPRQFPMVYFTFLVLYFKQHSDIHYLISWFSRRREIWSGTIRNLIGIPCPCVVWGVLLKKQKNYLTGSDVTLNVSKCARKMFKCHGQL